MNALDLRKQILFVCGEEHDNTSLLYDPAHVQRLFLWSVQTRLQDESFRAKIRPFLEDPNVIQQMSMATPAEKERDKKQKTNNRFKPETAPVSSAITAAAILNSYYCNYRKSEVEALKGEVRKQSSNQSVPHTKGPEKKTTSYLFKLSSEQHGLLESLFLLWQRLPFCKGMQTTVKP